MKRVAGILLFACVSLAAYGQVVPQEVDTVPDAVKNYDAIFNSLIKQSTSNNLQKYGLDIPGQQSYSLSADEEAFYPKLDGGTKTLDIRTYQFPPVLHGITVGSKLGVNQSMIGSFGFMHDYSYQSMPYKLTGNLSISSASGQNTIPGVGSVRSASAELNYSPFEWLQISGGGYGMKANIYGRSLNDFGYRGSMKFILTDRVRLNIYGQYSTLSESNMNGFRKSNSVVNVGTPMMHMMPQTTFGGSIEFKVNKNFGIEGGVMRELNPFNGKWQNTPFIAPVFYK